jgi:hypothetical protein
MASTREQVIFAEGAELILLLKANVGRTPYNVEAQNVQSIVFSYVKGGLFSKKPLRRIAIVVKNFSTVEYDEKSHKKYFDTYVELLRDFAHRNNVTFQDFPNS